jgi:hypothetical protein
MEVRSVSAILISRRQKPSARFALPEADIHSTPNQIMKTAGMASRASGSGSVIRHTIGVASAVAFKRPVGFHLAQFLVEVCE